MSVPDLSRELQRYDWAPAVCAACVTADLKADLFDEFVAASQDHLVDDTVC